MMGPSRSTAMREPSGDTEFLAPLLAAAETGAGRSRHWIVSLLFWLAMLLVPVIFINLLS